MVERKKQDRGTEIADLMIVDDEVLGPIRRLTQRIVGNKFGADYPFNVVGFENGTDALGYLRENIGHLPRGYLVDMRLEGSREELESSENIYEFLMNHGATEFFRFYTGHISEHDLQVKNRTGVEVILKDGISSRKLEPFIVELMKNQYAGENIIL